MDTLKFWFQSHQYHQKYLNETNSTTSKKIINSDLSEPHVSPKGEGQTHLSLATSVTHLSWWHFLVSWYLSHQDLFKCISGVVIRVLMCFLDFFVFFFLLSYIFNIFLKKYCYFLIITSYKNQVLSIAACCNM